MRIPGLAALGAVNNARHALDEIVLNRHDRSALRAVVTRPVLPLSDREALELLRSRSVGRFAYVARAGVPDVVPVNYAWCDAGILIRSGPGPKLQAAQRGEVVAFEVDDVDERTQTGVSVVVVGRATVIDPRSVASDVEPWAGGPHRHLVLIRPQRISGRRLAAGAEPEPATEAAPS
jgi:hypothetical protein